MLDQRELPSCLISLDDEADAEAAEVDEAAIPRSHDLRPIRHR